MKIYNKKLAARIAQNEMRLTNLRSRTGVITPATAYAESILQGEVNQDIAMLAKHGYDKYGQRLKVETKTGEKSETGELLVHSHSRNTMHQVQRGIELHYHVFSNVVKVGTMWQVRTVTKMNRAMKANVTGYAYGVIDVCAQFKLDTDRL